MGKRNKEPITTPKTLKFAPDHKIQKQKSSLNWRTKAGFHPHTDDVVLEKEFGNIQLNTPNTNSTQPTRVSPEEATALLAVKRGADFPEDQQPPNGQQQPSALESALNFLSFFTRGVPATRPDTLAQGKKPSYEGEQASSGLRGAPNLMLG